MTTRRAGAGALAVKASCSAGARAEASRDAFVRDGCAPARRAYGLGVMVVRSAVVAVVAAASTGCAYRTPAVALRDPIPALAPCAIDVDEVVVVSKNGDPPPAADVIRRETGEILADAAEARGVTGAPARVDIRVEVAERNGFEQALAEDGFAVFGLPTVALGLAVQRAEVSVEVTLQARGRTFSGRGAATRRGSIYASARRRALAVALDEALADAARNGAAG